jgi:hypothetical protein
MFGGVGLPKLQALVRDLLARERHSDEMNGFTPDSTNFPPPFMPSFALSIRSK